MNDPMTRQIRTTSLVCLALLVPFFAALSGNALDKVIFNGSLYNSWLWHMPQLAIWVLWLPAASLLLAVTTFAAYMFRPAQGAHGPYDWLARASDWRRVWPLALCAAIGFGILFMLAFHDSTHCWVQNPLHLMTHVREAITCTQIGYMGGR